MKNYAKHLGLYALLGSFAFISTSAFADEAIKLDGKPAPKPGRTATEVSENVMSDGIMMMAMGEQKMDGTCNMTMLSTTVTEELADGKLKRTIEKDQSNIAISVAGRANNIDKSNSLVGTPIIGVEKDGKWTFTLESGQPTPEQQKELDTQAKSEEIKAEIYQGRVVKVGESWSLSPEAVHHLLGDEAQNVTGSATMTLKSIEQHAGQRCAVLGFKFKATGTTIDNGTPAQMTMTMQGDIYRSLELFEDIKADFTGSMEMSSSPQAGMSMTMGGPLKITSTVTYKQ